MESGAQSNEYYYNLRAHFSYHEPTYRDYEVMKLWENVISYNPHQFNDKIVLEIGSGLGLFSMLAARAGARRVYSWEPSSISKTASDVVKHNNYDGTIIILSGPIEKIEIDEKVDVIFSTAFGYSLLFDSLIPSFIYARDKFLKNGGVVIPEKAEIYMSSCVKSTFNENYDYWENVYDFDFSPIEKADINNASVVAVSTNRIKTDAMMIMSFDLSKIRSDEITVNTDFSLKANDEHDLDSFLFWFALKFNIPNKNIQLNTSPFDPYTHYNQVALRLPKVVHLKKNDIISGTVKIYSNNIQLRPLIYETEYNVNGTSYEKLRHIFQ